MALVYVGLDLTIPDEILERYLADTEYGDIPLQDIGFLDRETVGNLLDNIVADNLPDLMEYVRPVEASDVEVSW
jgi:hypothetical protein